MRNSEQDLENLNIIYNDPMKIEKSLYLDEIQKEEGYELL